MTFIIHSGYGYSKILCEKVSSWYLNEFHLNDELNLHINHRSLKSEGATGFCYSISPYEYEIELDVHLNKTLYIKSLIHELCHLTQWVCGDLTLHNDELCYHNQPVGITELHESDTYSKETELFPECARFLSVTLNSRLWRNIDYSNKNQ